MNLIAHTNSAPAYTYDTPVTLGMLLEIAQAAHKDGHMPDAPPSLALPYINAIEDLIPNPYAGSGANKFALVE